MDEKFTSEAFHIFFHPKKENPLFSLIRTYINLEGGFLRSFVRRGLALMESKTVKRRETISNDFQLSAIINEIFISSESNRDEKQKLSI